MSSGRSVFLLGPGYIGIEILGLLVAQEYTVKTLVRRQEAATELEKKGATTIFGSLDDHEIIASATAEADIVIHTATADDLKSVEAILDGISRRAQQGKSSIYIHTSGCSEITDNSNGDIVSDIIFEDDHPEGIDALPDSAPHRLIDLAILKARKQLGEKAKISIVLPPVIYGVGSHCDRLSIQIPTMARFAMKHGYAGYVGGGKAVWGQIHVKDLARGYSTILHYMESTNASETLKNPYFFAENGKELSWGQMAGIVGQGLHKAGKLSSSEPKEIPKELYSDLFGDWSVAVAGRNARCRANRLRALGWNPKEKTTLESFLEDEAPILLKESGDFAGYKAAVAS